MDCKSFSMVVFWTRTMCLRWYQRRFAHCLNLDLNGQKIWRNFWLVPGMLGSYSIQKNFFLKWINRIISKRAHRISKIIFILRWNKFLAFLECVRSYAWSFGHSAPDPSSVFDYIFFFSLPYALCRQPLKLVIDVLLSFTPFSPINIFCFSIFIKWNIVFLVQNILTIYSFRWRWYKSKSNFSNCTSMGW